MFSSLSGASGLVSSALGGIVSSAGDITNNILSNYYAKKASSKEYQRSVELWNMQNEYNTPTNQMKRLREAGLNPNLAYGNLSSSAAGSIHVPAREDLRSPFQGLDLVDKYQDLRQKDAQIQNIEAQTALVNQQAEALQMENVENGENGTSRSTPYPVKIAKQVGHAIKKSADTLSSKMNQAVPTSVFAPFDYLDTKFIQYSNKIAGRKGYIQEKRVPTVSEWIRGKR